jgi:isochorismate synthase EntC
LDGLQGDGDPSAVSYADVHHLRANFFGMVREGVGLLDLVETLHPTPAVGGLPRQSALCWLEENEKLDRGWYSSPVGWVDGRGDGVFVVGIRSALIRDGSATAYAGCGLVSQSDAHTEWEESMAKLGPIRRSLVHRSVLGNQAKS